MSRTVHYVACAAVTAFFFVATLYITAANSTAETIDSITATPQIETFDE